MTTEAERRAELDRINDHTRTKMREYKPPQAEPGSEMLLYYETFVGDRKHIVLPDYYDHMSTAQVDTLVTDSLALIDAGGGHPVFRATLRIVHPDGSKHLRNYKRSGTVWILTEAVNMFSERQTLALAFTIFGMLAIGLAAIWWRFG